MKTRLFLIFSIISALFIMLACNRDNPVENTEKYSTARKTNQNSYNILYENENRDLEVILEKNDSNYTNYFTYKDTRTDITLFTLEYSFNNSKEGWKYNEQSRALAFAKKLQAINLKKDELETLNYMLDESYQELVYKINENSLDINLFSIISYLKSAASANLRAIENNSTVIKGTLSPTFLVDKTFFMFQEDLKVNLQPLKDNIELLDTEAKKYGRSSDLNLVKFIRETNKEIITYDELYSFYVPTDDFNDFIENVTFNEEDCSQFCVIGCGTDWGCCGSYTGCCYFSSLVCMGHDLACTDCKPAWFCLSGCKPDYGANRPVKLYLSL